jgi:hypothetical protein
MCQTNIYIDRYPDGREISFQQTQYCQYGQPGRPCPKHSTVSNPVRKINFNEVTTEQMMAPQRNPHQRVQFPHTPPRSRGGSHGKEKEDSPRPILRHHSKRHSLVLPTLKPHREHKKERIVIVDSPPTPRTPPMHFTRPQVFTAPSSPATPPFLGGEGMSMGRHERGRPIIVDERNGLLSSRRDQSITANVGERITIPERRRASTRNRSLDRGIFQWDSPSSSHTSFDSRARREAEEVERRRATAAAEEQERERREALEAARRQTLDREARIRLQDEEIRRRPAVPIPSSPLLRRRETIRAHTPVITPGLEQKPRTGMTAGELAIAEDAEIRRRMAERDREVRAEREKREEREKEREEEEAQLKRLRERQMPKRRFSVGPGGRRHRVLYDDGVYRWE